MNSTMDISRTLSLLSLLYSLLALFAALVQGQPAASESTWLMPGNISEVYVLAKTNETLLTGWKRPLENYSNISQYQMILKTLYNDSFASNHSLDVDKIRNAYMYIFVNLIPGTKYAFQVRACSLTGCGNWSNVVEATTADGHADSPENVAAQCSFNPIVQASSVNVTWDPPVNARGSILGYNVTVEGYSNYRNEEANVVLDKFKDIYHVHGNKSRSFQVYLKPNTNYTFRVCTVNGQGCGWFSQIKSQSICYTPSSLPASLPSAEEIRVSLANPRDKTSRRLKITLPRVSERNGPIKCYRVVMIRLPHDERSIDLLPQSPRLVNLSNYETVHSDLLMDTTTPPVAPFGEVVAQYSPSSSSPSSSSSSFSPPSPLLPSPPVPNLPLLPAAYAAEEFHPDSLVRDVIIGDENYVISKCTGASEEPRFPRRIKSSTDPPNSGSSFDDATASGNSIIGTSSKSSSFAPSSLPLASLDGILAPTTNYTGFVEVQVIGPNGELLTKRSDYFYPVLTGVLPSPVDPFSKSPFAPILATVTETGYAVIFGAMSGLTLVFLLLLSVLCFLRKKVSESTTSESIEGEGENVENTFGDSIKLQSDSSGDEHLTLSKDGESMVHHQMNEANFSTSPSSSLPHPHSIVPQVVPPPPQHQHPHPLLSIPPPLDCSQKWIGQPVYIPDLPLIFPVRHADNDLLFQMEFEELPESFGDRTTVASELAENVNKNRYADIKSFDQSRVRLSSSSLGESDYINANFVRKDHKLYICSQGPMDCTLGNFWSMIYEHRVSVLVMLCDITENGKVKCSQYWNEEEGKSLSVVDETLSVTLSHKRNFGDFIMRTFILQSKQEQRQILHFQFLLWNDFLSSQQPAWFLRFIRRVNEYYDGQGPLLVHCSGGIGRTGTFVAIDSLIPVVNSSEFVNIWQCVADLRHQRKFLVHSLKQYIFIYRAVMEYAQFGDTEVEICHLKDHYKQLREQRFSLDVDGLMAEFDRLNSVLEDPKSFCVGLMEENRVKNRYEFIIPYDVNRVILSASSAIDASAYINASFIQGYNRSLTFIVTQDPLNGPVANTISDFWRMVDEQFVTVIVSLNEFGDGLNQCPTYWPAFESTYGFVTVKFESEDSDGSFVNRKFTLLNIQTQQSRTVNQLQFMSWKSDLIVPESTLDFLALTETAVNLAACGPLLVHCSAGTDRCSLLVTLGSLLKQIHSDQRVDVFQSARCTRSQRPAMLQMVAQYDFLYKCAIDYIDSRNLCDMADTQL